MLCTYVPVNVSTSCCLRGGVKYIYITENPTRHTPAQFNVWKDVAFMYQSEHRLKCPEERITQEKQKTNQNQP